MEDSELGARELADSAPLLGNGKADGAPAGGTDGQATTTSATVLLLNTILGTGMLAMPHAFASGGLIPGLLTAAWCGLTAALGLYLLSRAAHHVAAQSQSPRPASFSSLAAVTFPSASKVFDAAIFLKCFGVSISYLIIIGSLMPKSIRAFVPSEIAAPERLYEDRRLWILLSMFVLVPLGFYRRLDSLKFISYVALCAVANLIFVVVYKFIEPSGIPERGPIRLFDLSSRFASSLPVQIFAFTCAQNLFAVFNELKDNSQARLNTVIGTSIGGATVIYEVLGCLGYLTFGALVGSNVIEQYPHSTLVSICQFAIVILVLFSYPLQLHPCRASLHHLLQPKKSEETIEYREDTPVDEIPLGWFVSETAFILLTTFIIAIYVTKLEVVLGFVGATGSTTISFILPALFFLALFRHSADEKDRKLLVAAGALLVWGVVVMIGSLGLNIYGLLKTTPSDIVLLGGA